MRPYNVAIAVLLLATTAAEPEELPALFPECADAPSLIEGYACIMQNPDIQCMMAAPSVEEGAQTCMGLTPEQAAEVTAVVERLDAELWAEATEEMEMLVEAFGEVAPEEDTELQVYEDLLQSYDKLLTSPPE
jgi:hypothetical protein